MNKNNFFMVALLGLIASVGTNFELHCSEQPSSLAPYIVVGTVVGGAVVITALTNTKTYETYNKDKVRRAEEKEKSDNSLLHAMPLPITKSGEKSAEDRVQAFSREYEQQRHNVAQKFANKITKETLPSHIIDDYLGQ